MELLSSELMSLGSSTWEALCSENKSASIRSVVEDPEPELFQRRGDESMKWADLK